MIVDVNVNLSRWPFRRLPHDETSRLVAKLREHDVASAWAGSFDGVLHRDLAAVNARLDRECKQAGGGLLVPFGSINPKLPDWKEDFRRCRETHGMPGIRLHPNYHGYELTDPVFAELLDLAARSRTIVQLVLKMEDERTQHSLVRVAAVDTGPLERQLAAYPHLPVVILNGLRTLRHDDAARLAAAGNVYFDISMLESAGGIARLLKSVPLERVVFGSHFPLFYFESAEFKLRESELGDFQTRAILRGNAAKLLPPPKPAETGNPVKDGR